MGIPGPVSCAPAPSSPHASNAFEVEGTTVMLVIPWKAKLARELDAAGYDLDWKAVGLAR